MNTLTLGNVYATVCRREWVETTESKGPDKRYTFDAPFKNIPPTYEERQVTNGQSKTVRSGDSFSIEVGKLLVTISIENEEYLLGFENGLYNTMIWKSKSGKLRTFKVSS